MAERCREPVLGSVPAESVGLAAVALVPESVPRHAAVRAHLHERAGDLAQAQVLYALAASAAGSEAERHHLTRQAARLHAGEAEA